MFTAIITNQQTEVLSLCSNMQSTFPCVSEASGSRQTERFLFTRLSVKVQRMAKYPGHYLSGYYTNMGVKLIC